VPYTLQIKESAQDELDCFHAKQRRLMEDRISALADNPRPSGFKPLKSRKFKGLCRIRAGNFRIIYQIQDSPPIVLIVKIGDRKDVYD
jgi:mRNA interferase RelE/StbE